VLGFDPFERQFWLDLLARSEPLQQLVATHRIGVATAYDETRDVWIYGLMINGGHKADGTMSNWPAIHCYQVEASEEPPPEPEPEPPETSTILILDADGLEVATVTVKPPYTFG